MELRLAVSKRIRAGWDSFSLVYNGTAIPFHENGKIVRDLRVKREVFTITKRVTEDIP